MKRFLIECNIPGVGAMDGTQLKQAAATSNDALAQLKGKAQWVESFVADDKKKPVLVPKAEKKAPVEEPAAEVAPEAAPAEAPAEAAE